MLAGAGYRRGLGHDIATSMMTMVVTVAIPRTTAIASVTAMTMAMAMRMARMADRDVQKLKTHAKKPQTFFREGRAGIHSNVSNRRAGGSV